MKRIVIDVNSVMPLYRRGWLTGIGRTTKELVEALNRLEELPFEIALYSQNTHGINASLLKTHFPSKHIYLPHKRWINRLLSHIPVRECLTHYDLLHIPHNFEWVRKPEKTVITLHDALFFSHPDEVFDYQYQQKNYPRLARHCRAIITCSQASKHDIMQYMDIPEEKIAVIPWGYNMQLFQPAVTPPPKRPFFLMVSCSTGRKNTPTLIRAYEQFAKQEPMHKLVLVWPNPPENILEQCNKGALAKQIQIVTNVDDNELARLYNQATATFFPSRYEGFGLPVLESMACGTPVVTSRGGALPEVGGDAALYVAPDDEEGLYQYMVQFEQGTLTKARFKEACLKQASCFSWIGCAKQTAKVYQQLLG